MASKQHEQLNELANLERLRLVRNWCLGLGLVACLIAIETIAGWESAIPRTGQGQTEHLLQSVSFGGLCPAHRNCHCTIRSRHLPVHRRRQTRRLIHHSQIRRMAQSRTGWIKAKNYPAECVATLLLSHLSSCRYVWVWRQKIAPASVVGERN